jgi:thiamine biosynthesis lipoprotein
MTNENSRADRRVELVMGMPIEVDVRDGSKSTGAIDAVFAWLREVDERFSTYLATSEVSRLNAKTARLEDLSDELAEILATCDELLRQTDGFFDVRALKLPLALLLADGKTVETGIDPSGYVKGWAVERATHLAEEWGSHNYCINAGGDIRLRGGALPEPTWRIGVQHPLQLDSIAAVVESSDLAIASSGEYARGRHIVDPHTGHPPEGVLSVTITGPDLAMADAYATAAFAMGDEGPRWTMSLNGYESMTIMSDQNVYYTPHFPRVEDSSK